MAGSTNRLFAEVARARLGEGIARRGAPVFLDNDAGDMKKDNAGMFDDIARTILPVDFRGPKGKFRSPRVRGRLVVVPGDGFDPPLDHGTS